MWKVICKLGRICVLSIKCRVLSKFVIRCVEGRGGRVWDHEDPLPRAHQIHKTNHPQSAYAQHILHNRHEYDTLAESMTLLKPLQHDSMLLPFEQFHIQSLHQPGKLIPEQYTNDPNPLFQPTLSHPHHTRHKTEPVKQHPANRTHNPQRHTRPGTWKPHVSTALLQMHAPVHHFRIHTITPYKRDTWPTDRNHQALHCKKPTKDTHTRPPWHSTHLVTNLDNTQHLMLRTQVLPNLQITFYIFTSRNTTDSNHCIILLSSRWWAVVPETCWASNKICNKNLCCI
jgi:hypothetical protein